MIKYGAQTLLIVSAILLCSIAQAASLQITVSIVPQKYFVEKIGGDLVDVNVMVRTGSSPATYEPQPRQMAQLSKADLYYAIGVPFERAWLPRFKSANKNLHIIRLSDCVVRMPMQTHLHNNKEEHEIEKQKIHHEPENHDADLLADPHIWLSPQLVRTICTEIRDSLILKDPKNTDKYRKNYLRFAQEINELDSTLLELFARQKKGLSFMVYHPSWGYFAKTYGLTQIPIELEGKTPSPKKLAHLIEFAKQNSVAAIFVQPQFSQKSAKAIATSIGAKILIADPLAEDWAKNLKKAAQTFIVDKQ